MNINVALDVREHFWHEPPPDSEEFWSFRFPPPCKVGEKLVFRFDGVIVATAICSRIEAPGVSQCQATGRYRCGYKVFWQQETFKRDEVMAKFEEVIKR